MTSNVIIFNKTVLRLSEGCPCRASAKGQRFANELILRGPALASCKGPVQACLQGQLAVVVGIYLSHTQSYQVQSAVKLTL